MKLIINLNGLDTGVDPLAQEESGLVHSDRNKINMQPMRQQGRKLQTEGFTNFFSALKVFDEDFEKETMIKVLENIVKSEDSTRTGKQRQPFRQPKKSSWKMPTSICQK